MKILKSESNNAYFNLAIEEYFFNNYNEDIFIIDTNEPSIVLGINQNAYEEINALYVKQSSIKVVRRLSGGEAIFQDLGNLNFSYISKNNDSESCKTKCIPDIILEFFKDKLKLNITLHENKHILIDDKRIGGYTKIQTSDKSLFHCSLIFSSNRKFLIDALKIHNPHPLHAKITSISAHLNEKISIENFKDLFYNYIKSKLRNSVEVDLSEVDKENINKLVKEKYSTWEWNYGKEIDFNYKNVFMSNSCKLEIYLQIESEQIKKAYFRGNFFSNKDVKELEQIFENCPYTKEAVRDIVLRINLDDYIENIGKNDFVEHFFE